MILAEAPRQELVVPQRRSSQMNHRINGEPTSQASILKAKNRLRPRNFVVNFIAHTLSVRVQADLTHLAFEVESLEEFSKHLARFGLKYSDGPVVKENGSGFAFVDAPEGYEIELMQRGKESASY